MDTKWNSTKKTALPGNAPEKGRLRTWRAFLLFFLGWSLVLGSCGTVLAQWDCQPSLSDLLESDWQQTEAFRQETAMYLKEFLTMGAGGDLRWYRYGTDIGEETSSMWDEEATDAFSEDSASPEPQEPDTWYRQDKNVLYSVSVDGTVKYGNTSPKNLTPPLTMEGYNFLLTFSDGKVSIWKDGREIDVYGDGIYRKQSAWFVPGYQNFPAGEDVKNVTVRMAVRKTPTLYYAGDYQNGGVYENCRMYWVTQHLAEGRQLYLLCAAALGLGAVLLAAARAFRRDRSAAERTLARWTHPVWTELRALLFLACFTAILFFRSGIFSMETADVFWNSDSFSSYMGEVLWRTLQGCLGEIPLVLGLFWLCWLCITTTGTIPKQSAGASGGF